MSQVVFIDFWKRKSVRAYFFGFYEEKILAVTYFNHFYGKY